MEISAIIITTITTLLILSPQKIDRLFQKGLSIRGDSSEKGCQLPGTEQGAVLDGLFPDESVARGSDALQQRVCRTGDGEEFHRDSGCKSFGCGDGAPRGLAGLRNLVFRLRQPAGDAGGRDEQDRCVE